MSELDQPPLPADEAFITTLATARDGSTLVKIHMPPGYYLYKDKLKFDGHGVRIAGVGMPKATELNDPFFGKVGIYHGTVVFRVDAQNQSRTIPGSIRITFQGCAMDRLCYPPTTRTLNLPYSPRA